MFPAQRSLLSLGFLSSQTGLSCKLKHHQNIKIHTTKVTKFRNLKKLYNIHESDMEFITFINLKNCFKYETHTLYLICQTIIILTPIT